MSIAKSNNSVHLIDEIRGLAIICMVFYHLAYSINVFHSTGAFSFNIPFLYEPWMNFLRDLFVGIFVFISGVSCNLSKNNVKRGVITIALALIVSLVTYVFVPSNLILFGILHMLGFCMLIYGLIKKGVNKLNNWIFVPVFFILFLLTFNIKEGYIGFGEFIYNIPKEFYSTDFLFWLGFPNNHFMSADYFPLLPWLLLFICGGLIGKNIHRIKKSNFIYKSHIPFFGTVGKYTIWIYLAHQPIIWGALYVISFCINNFSI